MYKRLITIIAAVIVLMVLAPCAAFADDDFTISSDGKVLVEYTGSSEVVTIPDGIETIKSAAFYGNSSIKKIIMPDTVKTIENQAFRFCDKVTEVKWSQNLETIDFSATEGMRSMRTFEIPESVTHIDDYNFSFCDDLEYVKLPEGITSIGTESFRESPKLRALTVPDSVTEIGSGCFSGCSDDFTIVAKEDSAAVKFAKKERIPFSTKGVEVPYTSSTSNKAELTVLHNGVALGKSAELETGDVIFITAHTTLEDINVEVNGKTINYLYYLQYTKNEPDSYPVVITGPTDVMAEGVSKGSSLDDSLNAKGSSLHFTSDLAEQIVDRGRRCGAYFTPAGTDGYIRTVVDLDKESYLMFDLLTPHNSSKIRIAIDSEEQELGEASPVPLSYAFVIPAGKHTITWYGSENASYARRSITLSRIKITEDLDEVHARAFTIALPQIDLEKGESIALEYQIQPAMLDGKKQVKWESDDPGVAKIENTTVTGVSKGSALITGTIDGVKAYVMCYVSNKTYGTPEDDDDPVYDELTFIKERTALPDDVKQIYYYGAQINHIKNDRYAYYYRANTLYRIDPISDPAQAESILTADTSISSAAVRGKIIYLRTNVSSSSGTCTIIGYDTVNDRQVYSQVFPYDNNTDRRFAVDDDGNVFFVKNNKDIYSYDKDGNLISKDIQSGGKLITGLGTIYIDQVDPFGYSLLTMFRSTLGRAVTITDDYSFQGFSAAFSFPYSYYNFTGCRKIRNGEIVDSENYIKNPDYSTGGAWTFLDRGNYAVNANGVIAKFKKDRNSTVGSDWDYLFKIPSMRSTSADTKPAAVYASGEIYVVNGENVIYRFDPETKKIKGTYDIGAAITALYQANGKVYAVGSEDGSWFATPLDKETYDEVKTIIRRDHVTLTYGEEEVDTKFRDSATTVDFSDSSQVFDELPQTKAPYKAGKLSDKVINDTLGRMNFARWQCGLNLLSLNTEYMDRNQKGAVLLTALNQLTHEPSQPSDMDDDFYKDAYKGCNASAEYSGNCSYNDSIYDAIKGYLDDTANLMQNNIGHRLSLLDKTADKTSFGATSRYSTLSMYYATENDPGNDESYYAWPSAGYFAAKMLSPDASWHVITDWTFYDDISITLKYKGKNYVVTEWYYDGNYGAFYFPLPKALKTAVVKNGVFKHGAEVNVRLAGLYDKKGNIIIVDYPVRFVNIHDHVWNTGTITKEATCAEEGEKTFTCKYCDEERVQTIPVDKSKHVWDSGKVTKEATWDESGEKLYTCTVCGETKTVTIPVKDPTKQMGEDGTPTGKGASIEAADKAITSLKRDVDPKGSKIAPLFVKSVKQAKKSVTITWKRPTGAKKFVIYGNQCGRTRRVKKLLTTTKTKLTIKKAVKKLRKGKYYKFIVVAINKNRKVVSTSKMIHVATKGGKVGNYKKVKTRAKKNRVSVKVGKTFKLAGKGVPVSKKRKVKVHIGIRYESSKPAVAFVSKKGVIKGKKKGTCYVYVYSQNGPVAKTKVTVR